MTQTLTQLPFTVDMLRDRTVVIIGLGSLGSPIFQNLLRMGVRRIEVWDADIVEARNRFNQRVFEADIGHQKVHGQRRIGELIQRDCTAEVVIHAERVTRDTVLNGIVIAAVDSNHERYQNILECVVRCAHKIEDEDITNGVSFFIDGRLGMDGGKIYGFHPGNEEHIARYRDPIHNHMTTVQVEGPCKTEFPVPATAEIVAGHMLWRMIRWLHLERGCMDPYDNFIVFYFIPQYTEVKEQWDEEEAVETVIQQKGWWWYLTDFVQRLFSK